MIHIVIVDDEEIICHGLRFTLSQHYGDQISIQSFFSSTEALAYCKENPVNILLTDINMPQMNGLEMATQLQSVKPDLQIIFLTGYADFDYAYSAIQMKNANFILKIEPDSKLLAIMDSVMTTLADTQQTPPLLEEPETADASYALIAKLEAYICQNLNSDLSLNLLAQMLHFNPSYLSRFYKKYRNKTISDFIQEAKLNKAKELLAAGNYRIKDIALALGFESSSYFGLFFKKQTGMSPRRYMSKKITDKK